MILALIGGCTTRTGVPRDAGGGSADAGLASDAGVTSDTGLPRPDAGPGIDAGPRDAGPLAMCPPPGAPLPEVPYLDRPAGAFVDPAGCSGCPAEVVVESSSVAPGGTVATIDVALAADAPETACTLYVVGECGRAAFEVPWSEFGRPARTVPLFCGSNRIIVVCENGAGRSVRVTGPLMAQPCAAGSIRATLTWDDCGTDHELHLIRDGARLYDPVDDCTWNDCTRAGRLDWPPLGSTAGDATKDIDDTGASGIENGRVASAAPGAYHVLVEMWGSVVSDCTSTESRVDIFVDEVLAASLTQPLALHEVWYVGVVEMPAGTFTPATALGGRTTTAPVTDCAAAWGLTIGSLNGCTLAIPSALGP